MVVGMPALPCGVTVLLLVHAVVTSESPEAELAAALDDECISSTDEGDACALSALQRRGVKVRGGAAGAATHGSGEEVDSSMVYVESGGAEGGEDWSVFGSSRSKCDAPINCFNDQLDSVKFLASEGLFYEFVTAEDEVVWRTEVEGLKYYADETVTFPLASSSKLFTAFAAMVTMQKKPNDWYPEKFANWFPGWEDFSNFQIAHSYEQANLTIHQLLTHTSGLPFAMRSSKEDIQNQKLFYKPGTGFGYTVGHRIIGWMLRDYWKNQPETRHLNFQTVNDVFKWLVYDPLGMSKETKFSDYMTQAFGYAGQAGDAAIQSNAKDFSKLAVVALRRGKLLDGTQIISEENWNRWAVPNLLPGGKMTKDLTKWQGVGSSWANWNYGGMKESIMRQSGDYGWNYFGATYKNSKEIGWCGFFSSCLRVTYEYGVAFVMTQRDVSDLKHSKPYVVKHFGEMAKSLMCKGGPKCAVARGKTVFCQSGAKVEVENPQPMGTCPARAQRGKGWGDEHKDTYLDPSHHACYLPPCA